MSIQCISFVPFPRQGHVQFEPDGSDRYSDWSQRLSEQLVNRVHNLSSIVAVGKLRPFQVDERHFALLMCWLGGLPQHQTHILCYANTLTHRMCTCENTGHRARELYLGRLFNIPLQTSSVIMPLTEGGMCQWIHA